MWRAEICVLFTLTTLGIFTLGAIQRLNIVFTMCQDTKVPKYLRHFLVVSDKSTKSNRYSRNLNCHLFLDTRRYPVILVLYFKTFDLEFDDNCLFDSLTVQGRTFCGSWLQGKTLKILVEPYKTIKFSFFTDFIVTRRGFTVDVGVISYFEGETVMEYGGPGSHFVPVYMLTSYSSHRGILSMYPLYPPTPNGQTHQYHTEKLGFLDTFPKQDIENSQHVTIHRTNTSEMKKTLKDEDGSIWFEI